MSTKASKQSKQKSPDQTKIKIMGALNFGIILQRDKESGMYNYVSDIRKPVKSSKKAKRSASKAGALVVSKNSTKAIVPDVASSIHEGPDFSATSQTGESMNEEVLAN
jgi:hypothetical protein